MQRNSPGKGKSRKALAKHVRLLRTAQGLSQEALAEVCGLHRTYISMIERGVCNIGVDNIERLATALGISIEDLVDPLQPIQVEDAHAGIKVSG